MIEQPPSAWLAPYVQSFAFNQRVFGPSEPPLAILPDTSIECVWNLGAPCSLITPDAPVELPRGYIVGLLRTPLYLHAQGLVQAVRARFYPWGLQPLLGTAVRPSHIPSVLWLDAALQPPPALIPTDDPQQALEHLQQTLLQRVLATTLPTSEAIEAAQALLAQRGEGYIQALADQLGISERSLRRKFHLMLHTGPKEFARLARFEHMRDLIWQQPDRALADAALQAGYSDQAHMQREFRTFSRTTPRQFASAMRSLRTLFATQVDRNLQDF